MSYANVKDGRYTVEREYCGYVDPHWVVRFCDDWVGHFVNREDAERAATEHNRERMKEYDQ